eukprot:COSAG01_NODE_73524_length_243_cov_2.680556_1_plen_27_part_10
MFLVSPHELLMLIWLLLAATLPGLGPL